MAVKTRALILFLLAAFVPAAVGCGKTERSGAIGEKLSAKGLEVTVEKVDTAVPVPARDITGLSQPALGFVLVGARVRVCSNHAGATGPYDFGIETTGGDHGRLKFPETNYPDSFDSLRNGCGGGWVVFEVPRGTTPKHVTFGFEDTGSFRREHTRVDARFSWSVAG
jgi:hypothetical protein